jgi:hypothetical protein
MLSTDQLKVPIISPVEAHGLVATRDWAFAHFPLLARTLPLQARLVNAESPKPATERGWGRTALRRHAARRAKSGECDS